jgi:hypothetical protein
MATTTTRKLPTLGQINRGPIDGVTKTILIRRCIDRQDLGTVAATYGMTRREVRALEVAGLQELDRLAGLVRIG